MLPTVIALHNKAEQLSEPWSPRVIAEMNDYQFKVVLIMGEFTWHAHADTDETFLVLAGEMGIAFREGSVTLRAGELLVVPRGVEHKPFATSPCQALLIEPRGVINTGDTGGVLTAPNDRWL